MDIIVVITIIALITMGLFHCYWAIGGKIGLDKTIPTKNGKALLKPSKISTLSIGIALFGFAHIAYSLHFKDTNSLQYINYYKYIAWGFSVIFIIRAIGEFNTMGFFKKIKGTIFADFDTKYWSPLCLILGIIFFSLAYKAL